MHFDKCVHLHHPTSYKTWPQPRKFLHHPSLLLALCCLFQRPSLCWLFSTMACFGLLEDFLHLKSYSINVFFMLLSLAQYVWDSSIFYMLGVCFLLLSSSLSFSEYDSCPCSCWMSSELLSGSATKLMVNICVQTVCTYIFVFLE